MSADALAAAAIEIYGEDRVTVVRDLAEAIDRAATLAEAGEAFGDPLGSGAVLVTGSVVTVGEARAMLLRGASRERDLRRPAGPAPHNTERSPRRGMCAAVLCLEAITLGLTTPVLITIADVPVGPGRCSSASAWRSPACCSPACCAPSGPTPWAGCSRSPPSPSASWSR